MSERAIVLKCVTFDFWFCLFFCTASSPQRRVGHHSWAHNAPFLHLPEGPQYQLFDQYCKQTAQATGNQLPEKKDMKMAYRELKAQHPRPIPAAVPYTPTGSKHEAVPLATGKVLQLTLLLALDEAKPALSTVIHPGLRWNIQKHHMTTTRLHSLLPHTRTTRRRTHSRITTRSTHHLQRDGDMCHPHPAARNPCSPTRHRPDHIRLPAHDPMPPPTTIASGPHLLHGCLGRMRPHTHYGGSDSTTEPHRGRIHHGPLHGPRKPMGPARSGN